MPTVPLGFQVPDYSECCPKLASPEPERKMKTAYPTFCIPGNRTLAKGLRVDQEFTATVTFRVKEVAIRDKSKGEGPSYDDQYGGTRVELEATEMVIKDLKEESEEESGSEALSRFLEKKNKS